MRMSKKANPIPKLITAKTPKAVKAPLNQNKETKDPSICKKPVPIIVKIDPKSEKLGGGGSLLIAIETVT